MPGVQAQIYVAMHLQQMPQTVDGTRVLELASIIYDDHGSTMIYVFFKVYAMLPERQPVL